MKVIKTGIIGFCMGVRRAVETAEAAAREAEKSPGDKVYTLGPLIHNPQVLAALKSRGVETLDEKSIAGFSGGTVVLRAHGVSPSVEAELVRRGAKIIDATCPRVKASQMKARALSGEGFFVFLAGEKEHAEIIGIRGYVQACRYQAGLPADFAEVRCRVVANPAEAALAAARLLEDLPSARAALIGQTTITAEEYRAIGEELKKYFPGLEIINTICGATEDRQDALRELAPKVDAFVIAGGRDSANTRRLLSVAESCGKKAWLVENAGEIPPEVFSRGAVGLSAGASTPDKTIDEIERALLDMADCICSPPCPPEEK